LKQPLQSTAIVYDCSRRRRFWGPAGPPHMHVRRPEAVTRTYIGRGHGAPVAQTSLHERMLDRRGKFSIRASTLMPCGQIRCRRLAKPCTTKSIFSRVSKASPKAIWGASDQKMVPGCPLNPNLVRRGSIRCSAPRRSGHVGHNEKRGEPTWDRRVSGS
jgi:hypothetical protein